jgi:hypothetical protein
LIGANAQFGIDGGPNGVWIWQNCEYGVWQMNSQILLVVAMIIIFANIVSTTPVNASSPTTIVIVSHLTGRSVLFLLQPVNVPYLKMLITNLWIPQLDCPSLPNDTNMPTGDKENKSSYYKCRCGAYFIANVNYERRGN